jgi:hypothetical protein
VEMQAWIVNLNSKVSMEEILSAINYLIREKFWCSIRTLIDKVRGKDIDIWFRNFKKAKIHF